MKEKKGNIAVNIVWFERFVECSRTQGTDAFVNSVWRFYWSLIDLGEGDYAIKTKVDEYIKNEWLPDVQNRYQIELAKENSETDSIKRFIYSSVESDRMPLLFRFIIQTIQNSKLGWKLPMNEDEAWDYKDAIG